MAGLDLGAMVSLDHNYAQVCPIRIKGKESHLALTQSLWPPLNSSQTPRRQRTKSYNSDRVSETGETLEEDDLIEYYSQWCDRVFSGENPAATELLLQNTTLHGRANPGSKHGRSSASFSTISNDYDSFDKNHSDSTQRTSPSTDSLNNLNLLASCGSEDHQRSRAEELPSKVEETTASSSRGESGTSTNLETVKEGGYDSPKLENDYQVLAAANALLQLSGTEKLVQDEGEPKKRKMSEVEPIHSEGSGLYSMYGGQTTLNSYSPRKYKANNGIKVLPKLKYAPTTLPKKPLVYSASRSDLMGKRKKKKRKYRKAGKGATDDDDSIDSELNFPKIMFMSRSVLAQRGDPWGQATPEPVLTRIFLHIIHMEGPIPALCRLSSVCKLWYTAARDPLLWQDLDLSGERIKKTNKHFHWLCKNRLSAIKQLNLANWEQLTGRELQVLSKNCSRLQSLSLSRCSKLNSSALRGLIENSGSLAELDISHTSTVITSRYLLDYLLEVRGPQLTCLNLSCNILVKFDTVLHSLITKCSRLEVLDLSNVVFSSTVLPLHIEDLQAGCPCLRVLLLSNSLFKLKKSTMQESVASICGFPRLESLSVARSTVNRVSKFRYINDDVLFRFLKTSEKLQHLDVSGCRHVTNRGLQKLPINNLRSLNISHCSLVNHPEITDTIAKWSHSLDSLDLGGNTLESILLRSILDRCLHLSSLSLTSCQGLPWEVRKDFQKDTMPELRELLAYWRDEEGNQ